MAFINQLISLYTQDEASAFTEISQSSQFCEMTPTQTLGTCRFADIYDIREIRDKNAYLMLIRDSQRWAIGVIHSELMLKWKHLRFDRTIVRCAVIRVNGVKEVSEALIGPKLIRINGGSSVLQVNMVEFQGIGPTLPRPHGPIHTLDSLENNENEIYSPEEVKEPPREIWVTRDPKHMPIPDSTSESEGRETEESHSDLDQNTPSNQHDNREIDLTSSNELDLETADTADHSSDSGLVYSETGSPNWNISKGWDVVNDKSKSSPSQEEYAQAPSSPAVQDNEKPCTIC